MNPALKKKIYHYAMVTLACAIMGIAMNTFYMPNKMLSGGIGGVAVLAYYVAGLPMGATSLICNVPLFFLAYKYRTVNILSARCMVLLLFLYLWISFIFCQTIL